MAELLANVAIGIWTAIAVQAYLHERGNKVDWRVSLVRAVFAPLRIVANAGPFFRWKDDDAREWCVAVNTNFHTEVGSTGRVEWHTIWFLIDGNGVRYSRFDGPDIHTGAKTAQNLWKSKGILPNTSQRQMARLPEAFSVLGLDEASTEIDVKRSFRDLVKKHHPDVGGSAKKFAEIVKAKDDALAAIALRKARAA